MLRIPTWRRVPKISRYYFRLFQQIFSDTFSYFTEQIVTGLVLGVIAALVSRQVGWIPRGGVLWTVLVALVPYTVMVAVALIINTIRAPVKLDNRLRLHARRVRTLGKHQILKLRTERDQLEQTLAPRRSRSEDHHFALAQAAIQKHGPDAIKVLRHLKKVGKMQIGFYQPPLPEGMTLIQTQNTLHTLAAEGITRSTPIRGPGGDEYIWEIGSGFASVLDELLYE